MAFYLGGSQPCVYIDSLSGRPFIVAGGRTFESSLLYHSQQHMYPGSYIGPDGRLVVHPDVYRNVQEQTRFNSAVLELHTKLHKGDTKSSISSSSKQSRVTVSSGSQSRITVSADPQSTIKTPGGNSIFSQTYNRTAF